MLRFEKTATIKSVYDFGDIVLLTIYYYLQNQYIEHQMEFSKEEIEGEYGYADHTLLRQTFEIEIQIFTDSNNNEMVTVRKI